MGSGRPASSIAEGGRRGRARSSKPATVMYMTPTTGRSPGRKGVHEVRQALSTTFKVLGHKAVDEDTSNWEGRIRRSKTLLAECHAELEVNLRKRYLYDHISGAAEPIAKNEELHKGIATILDTSSSTKEGKISELITEVSRCCQAEYLTKLKTEVAEVHAGKIDTLVKKLDGIAAAMRQHESRSTGIRVGPEPVGDTIVQEMMRQFVADNNKVFEAHKAVTDITRAIEGMKAARAAQNKTYSLDEWQRGADLKPEDLERLTKKEAMETVLDERITEMNNAKTLETKHRSQVSLDILGSGTADLKQTRSDVNALKKLKDKKLETMDMNPDPRIASLIRTQVLVTAKANVNQLWAIAPALKVLTSSNLIGKDMYIIKNNDLVPQEDEDDEKYLRRMEQLGFGHGMSDDWANWGDEAAKPVMEPEPELQPVASTPAPTPKPGSGDGVKPAEPKVKKLTAEERMRITQRTSMLG